MYIEKNICDSIVGTLINIDGKTKDTTNVRKDLVNLDVRKELHLRHDSDRCSMSVACYTLNRNERRSFCDWLSK